MLTQWVVMVLNCNVLCHLQQCKCPDQHLWAPLYLLESDDVWVQQGPMIDELPLNILVNLHMRRTVSTLASQLLPAKA